MWYSSMRWPGLVDVIALDNGQKDRSISEGELRSQAAEARRGTTPEPVHVRKDRHGHWELAKAEFEKHNVFFQKADRDTYIEEILCQALEG